MALGTYSKIDETGLSPNDVQGILVCTFKGDASYTTGGYANFEAFVQTQTARGTKIVSVSGVGVKQDNSAAYLIEYDNTNDKLVVRLGTTLLEAANAADLSTVTFRATIRTK